MTDKIDLTAINFPSDKLTFLQIRRAYPRNVDSLRSEKQNSLDDILSGLIDVERKFAEVSFDDALKRANRWTPYWESQRESLAYGYIEFGLAKEPEHAEQLIRDIETQARQQALARGGQRG